ncbi:MAG: sugar transferase, partial [Deltaproteobacteria bacterium]|nr:sugar transferase [Deltaproteobacteria bacterium]
MITDYPVLTRLVVALLDTLVTILSFVIATYARNAAMAFYGFGTVVNWTDYWPTLIVIILVWRGLLGYQDAYVGQRFTSLKTDIMIVVKTVAFGTLVVLTAAFMMKLKIPRTLIAFFAMTNLILLSVEKAVLYQFIGYVRKWGRNIKSVLVLGEEDVAEAFVRSVEKYPDWGIKILGLIGRNERDVGEERFGYSVIGHSGNLRELLHSNPIDELVIALPARGLGEMEEVMAICDEEGVPVRIVSSFFRNIISKAKTDMIHGLPIIKFSSVERKDFEALLKRSVDVVGSIVLLVLLAPAFAVIAVLIKLDSPGPVFYRWRILGLNKRPLTSYKFRTMVENADDL